MREILFRGKAVGNGEFLKCKGKWVEGGITFFNDKTPYICPERFSDYDEEIEVDPDTVSEFTGLRDKKGNRIFDGDIVRLTTLQGYVGNVLVQIGEYFDGEEHYIGVYGSFVGSRQSWAMLAEKDERYEVIGNKWDNPELLEGGAV